MKLGCVELTNSRLIEITDEEDFEDLEEQLN